MSLQVIINGIATGSIYALIATGFALIFNVLKFSNFSHGATMTAAAFIAYFLVSSKGMGLLPTLLIAALAGALISLFGEFVGFRRILKNHSAPTYFFVSSITLGTLYEGLVTIKAGSNFFNFPSFFKNPTVNVAALVVSTGDLMMFGISTVALIVLAYVIQKTRLGRALRAVSFDRDTAQLMGIDSTRIIQLAFVISGILAGIAGVFLGIKYTLYPTLGSLVVKGFIASVIGGLGSLTGAVIGALLLGILETILLAALGSGYSTIAVFAVMLVFLLIRPQRKKDKEAKTMLDNLKVGDRIVKVISNGMVDILDYISCYTQEELEEIGVNEDDMDNISNFPRTVAGVRMAATLRETGDGETKLSVRAVPGCDATAVTVRFGGGGHKGAAGASMKLPLDEAVKAVEAVMLEVN